MPLSQLLEEVVTPHRPFGIPILIRLPQERTGEPVIARNPAILYGLGNLLENAVDYARGEVTVSSEWNDDEIAIVVTDDGLGFAPEVIHRIGEPYVTMRRRWRAGETDQPGGFGLGIFIAKTLLERTGASLSLTNRSSPDSGAVVRVRWSRELLELNLNAEGRPDAPIRVEPQAATTLASERSDH
jgi:two-component system sensor histidine kinase RegB